MKALVLCGGLPQIALVKELKSRGIYVLVADMNEKVAAYDYADEFYCLSVLDVDAIRNLASEQKVDFLISVCADQVLQVVAQVSEELELPCYIDFETAVNVSKKSYMKEIFIENDVPTARFVIMNEFCAARIAHLEYPLIVKPVDSYSSRGVRKVNCETELKKALEQAVEISRTKTAIVEEFVEGDEITVDVYVENGKAHILCMSNLYKIGEDGKFVINRSRIPANISNDIATQIEDAAQKIAQAFKLYDTPMLIQLISNGEKIAVVEFCARTGGQIKFLMIKKFAGFDVIKAVVDLTLGIKPKVGKISGSNKITINEFVYCRQGELSEVLGFEDLFNEKIITEYLVFKKPGFKFKEICSSSDRLAYFSIEADSIEDVKRLHKIANERICALSICGEDLIRHDLIDSNNI